MKKFMSLLLIMSMTILLLAACGTKSENEPAKDPKQETINENASPGSEDASSQDKVNEVVEKGPITITHTMGATTIPGKVKKAVVFDFGVLDMIQTLEIDVELAAPISSLPAYLSNYGDAANAGNIKEPDLEAIFDFEPDVIFIGGRQASYYDQLSEIAPTIYIQLNGDTYMEDFNNSLSYVAEVFDKQEEAAAKLAELNARIEEVKALATASDSKAIIIMTNDGSLSAYGFGSRFGIVHDVLNVKSADETIESSTHGQSVNYEYISAVNPDILFVIDRTVVVGGDTTANATLDNDLVNGTIAAKNNMIISLSPDIWYLSGGGLHSISAMIEEVAQVFQ